MKIGYQYSRTFHLLFTPLPLLKFHFLKVNAVLKSLFFKAASHNFLLPSFMDITPNHLMFLYNFPTNFLYPFSKLPAGEILTLYGLI